MADRIDHILDALGYDESADLTAERALLRALLESYDVKRRTVPAHLATGTGVRIIVRVELP